MSEQLWTGLPFVTQPNKDDELLLVNGEEQSRRITVQNLIYSQLAELSWTIPGTQDVGVGTANAWGNILFNNLSGPGWISLNADGSWVLDAGIYFLDLAFQCARTQATRTRLFDGSNALKYRHQYLGSSDLFQHDVRMRGEISIDAQKTISLQINTSVAQSQAFHIASAVLSGFSPVIAQGFIWRLG
jgi:hypothetical protein